MDPGNPDVMNEKPRDPKENFFANGGGLHIIIGGILIGALTISAFWFGYYEHGHSPFDNAVPVSTLEYARTMAFMVLIFSQLFYSLTLRSRTKSIFQTGIFSNKYLTASIILGVFLQLFVIFVPFMRSAFGLQMLDWRGWIIAFLLGLVPLILNEFLKLFLRAFQKT
jgi:Ca2+-transporting ATPase